MKTIDIEYAKEKLDYNPETGIFTRKTNHGGRKKGSQAGTLTHDGYIRIFVNRKAIMAHRLAWLLHYDEMSDMQIDHINAIKSDNRISNLRLCSHSQNQANKALQRNNKSGYKGVHWNKKARKWVSRICIDGKKVDLGFFDKPEEGSIVYNQAADKYFGEFARY